MSISDEKPLQGKGQIQSNSLMPSVINIRCAADEIRVLYIWALSRLKRNGAVTYPM